MKNSKADNFDADIVDVAFGGDGVAKLNTKVFFIPGVIDGEKVSAKPVDERRQFSKALCTKLLLASPHRIEPACLFALVAGEKKPNETCCGCSYQCVSYAYELEIKRKQLESLLLRIGKLKNIPAIDIIPSPKEIHYRNKISLHVAKKKDGRNHLGYIMGDNKSIIEVRNCPLAVEEINECISKILSDGDVLNAMLPSDILCLRFSRNDGVLCWNKKDAPSDKMMTENTCVGEIRVPANSFFQVNIFASDMIFSRVLRMMEEIRPDKVLDFYSGAGIFSFCAAKAGAKIAIGIESDLCAVNCAKLNASRLGFDMSTQFIGAPVEIVSRQLLKEDAGSGTLAIIDPPRAGLHERLISDLIANPTENIIYISCAPDTMSRDIHKLCAQKYAIEKITLADIFPRTSHFETIVLLRRR